jgi:transcriptional regulator with XRE-family HTH domain
MKKISLAQFISTTREKEGYSQQELAARAYLPLEVIESIESGQDLFLAPTIRQKLAKGLKLELKQIKAHEKVFEQEGPSEETIEILKQKILSGETKNNYCPACGSELVCRTAKMYDLEDNLILHPKAKCSKCPFQIK